MPDHDPAMRITGSHAPAAASTSGGVRKPSGERFSLSGTSAAQDKAAASGPRAVGTIDALMALQGVEDPRERRRRAVKGGRSALDALEGLKVGLLDGTLEPEALVRLKGLAGGLTEGSGDRGLDGILGEIALRVEVELAKAGVR